MSRAFMIKQVPFKPTDIGGCQLWLDASDSTTISLTGSTVTQINDKSGNANNTSSSTGTVTYTATGLNSRPAFSFNATGGFRGPISITGTTLTAFTVATLNSGVNYNGRLLGLANATQNDYAYATTGQPFFCRNGGPNVSGYRNNTYMSYQTNTFDIPFIGTSQFTGSSNITSINGTPGTAVADANGSFSITKYGFGCEGLSDAGVNWYGYCSEMILYNSLLSTPQRQQVEAYLAQKWGLRQQLPPGHPGITAIVYPSDPVNLLVRVPYQSVFTPSAVGTVSMWLDGADPAGTGIKPSNGATVSTWVDKSGSGINLTAVGTPTYVTASSSIYLNGGSYLQNTNFNFTNYTLFIVSVQASDQGPLYTNNTTTGGNSGFFPRYSNGNYYLVQSDGGWLSAGSPFANGTTYLYSIQYDSLNNINLWSNGSISPVITGTAGTITRNKFILGKRDASGFNENMTGNVFEVVQYNSDLGQSSRQQVEGYLAWKWGLQANLPPTHTYKNAAPIGVTNPAGISRPAGLPIPPIACYPTDKFINPNPIITTGLTNRWFFNEGTGTTFADSVGGQTGTLYGNPRWIFVNERKGIYLANTTPGNNSATQYGTTTGGQPASVFATINWSLTVWMYPLTYLIEGADVFFGVGNYMDMYVGTASGQLAMYCNLTPSYGLAAAGTGVQKNVWSQITITCLNGAVTSYINGTLTTTGTYTTQTYVSSSISYIGAYQNTAYGVNMYLSDMRVYNRALTQTEINQIYANTG